MTGLQVSCHLLQATARVRYAQSGLKRGCAAEGIMLNNCCLADSCSADKPLGRGLKPWLQIESCMKRLSGT